MKKAATKIRAITFAQLRRHFEASGFRVVLRHSKTIDRLATDPTIRTRVAAKQTLGLIMPEEGEIAINQSLPKEERVVTLLHELVHLYDESLSEKATESRAQRLYHQLKPAELGWLEFVVSRT